MVREITQDINWGIYILLEMSIFSAAMMYASLGCRNDAQYYMHATRLHKEALRQEGRCRNQEAPLMAKDYSLICGLRQIHFAWNVSIFSASYAICFPWLKQSCTILHACHKTPLKNLEARRQMQKSGSHTYGERLPKCKQRCSSDITCREMTHLTGCGKGVTDRWDPECGVNTSRGLEAHKVWKHGVWDDLRWGVTSRWIPEGWRWCHEGFG